MLSPIHHVKMTVCHGHNHSVSSQTNVWAFATEIVDVEFSACQKQCVVRGSLSEQKKILYIRHKHVSGESDFSAFLMSFLPKQRAVNSKLHLLNSTCKSSRSQSDFESPLFAQFFPFGAHISAKTFPTILLENTNKSSIEKSIEMWNVHIYIATVLTFLQDGELKWNLWNAYKP